MENQKNAEMNEIYWITRIGVLSDIAILFSLIIGLSLALLIPFYLCECIEDEDNILICKRLIKIASVAFMISVLSAIFIPSKKDLLLMYGVGGTIDYIKDNNNAKQLPDKCIKALNAYLDELTKDED